MDAIRNGDPIPCPRCGRMPCTYFAIFPPRENGEAPPGYGAVYCPSGHTFLFEHFEHLIVQRHGGKEVVFR